jgi:AAA+ ATPase superfamily predicted ATPase
MFRTNVPVTDEGFHDRSDELARLLDIVSRLESGETGWLAIIGPRKIGKTSLMLELQRRASSPSLVFLVIDTFEQLPPSPEVFRRYGLRFLDGVMSSELGVSLEALAHDPPRFRSAIQASSRFTALPAALRGQVLELPDRKVDASFVETALQLPERVAEALDLRVLVAWDEFQELASLDTGRAGLDVFPLMRSIWQRHRRVGYVISGSRRSLLTELVASERSPFFHHFSLMDLGPFPTDEAVGLLLEHAPDRRHLGKTFARRAVEVIGGHPFYLQMLGEVVTSRPPPYDEAALKEALQDLLFSRTGRLALYFESIFQGLVGRSTGLAATLQSLADGPRRLTEVAQAIGASSGATVRYLERLGDAVERTDNGRYRLTDSTFGLWLRWRKPGGTVVPMAVVGDEAERRVAEHLSAMGFDLVYQSRASRGAFDLLATRGARQLGLQIKRSKPPLRFKRSEWSRMEAEGRRFGWVWVVAAVLPPPDHDILMLDPAGAHVGREVRLAADAGIANLLAWIDERRPAPSG